MANVVFPRTLKVNADGDLDLSSGKLVLTTDLPSFVAQKIDELFQFFLGEWFIDIRQGFPYFKHVIKQSPSADLPLLETLYLRAIRAVPGVQAVESFALTFNRTTRALQITFRLKLTDGSVIGTVEPFILDLGDT